jgi:hypothetical protein
VSQAPTPPGRLDAWLDEMRAQAESLVRNLQAAQGAGSQLRAELDEVAEQQDLLANLYTVLRRLHGSLRLDDVIAAMGELLTNLIGTEDFAIYLREGDSQRFRARLASGRGAERDGFTAGEGFLGVSVEAGTIRYGDDGQLIALVPLASSLGRGPIGLVAILGLLAHKPRLVPRDQVVLDLFLTQAALAVEAALCVEAQLAGPEAAAAKEAPGR